MSGSLLPQPRLRFFDANGEPLAGGFVYTYQAGTTTPLATYTDSTLAPGTQNTNPIELDAEGYCDIWIGASIYKIALHDADDVPIYVRDNVTTPAALTGEITTDTFVADGLTTVFELSASPSNVDSVIVVVDGVVQLTDTYTVDDDEVTLSEAPADGANVEFRTFGTVALGSVTDGTVRDVAHDSESATSMQPLVADGSGGATYRTFMGGILDGTTFTPFSIVNNQSSAANVTGLLFAGATYRSVFIWYEVYRNTTAAGATERIQSGLLVLNYKTVANTWDITEVFRLGEAGVTFDVDYATTPGSAQVTYTSDNQTGTAATSRLKALVSAIGA